ncbi:hypothetical protein LM701345_90317 [Listeria monocytogenes]|nr:hypothetical protein LM701345_90317 [Listeria monocytogenes]CUL34595.1 hypothetical protein LM7420_190320 [Listeria monocytogenes]CUL44424.1 hypothetical protein LM7421_180319 [Listeria monocytogenes]CUL45370.1 hypothetical protein LM7422_180028 [Listeria monocytogenes]
MYVRPNASGYKFKLAYLTYFFRKYKNESKKVDGKGGCFPFRNVYN